MTDDPRPTSHRGPAGWTPRDLGLSTARRAESRTMAMASGIGNLAGQLSGEAAREPLPAPRAGERRAAPISRLEAAGAARAQARQPPREADRGERHRRTQHHQERERSRLTRPTTQLPLHERLGLGPRGPELLAGAVAAIRANPETYDQSRYEPGPLACDTPGCVASHIVDQDPALRRTARDLAEKDGDAAVGNVAAEGLGLQLRPGCSRAAGPPAGCAPRASRSATTTTSTRRASKPQP